MDLKHYQPLKWDDSSSERLYQHWINTLDGEKLFFTEEDLSKLKHFSHELDEELNGKGWAFFDQSLSLFKKRVNQTDSIIRALLKKPADFSPQESGEWPYLKHATNTAASIDRWRKYLKWRILEKIAAQFDNKNKDLNKVLLSDLSTPEITAREKTLQQEISYLAGLTGKEGSFENEKGNQYLDAIAWCYDPHSNYMNLKEKTAFESIVNAKEYTTGIQLGTDDKGESVVEYLQPGGSAWRSGKIHKGDALIKVAVGGVETVIDEMKEEDDPETLLNGVTPAEVTITIKTVTGELKTVQLTREKVSEESSVVKSYVLHGQQNIGYIQLPGFYSRETDEIEADKQGTKQEVGCANDVSKEIIKLQRDTIKGLILDLRFNGGGSMWEAMQLSGIFIDYGPVASVKGNDGKVHFLKDPNRGTIYDGPLLILVNAASASASEFTSAVLQDYHRAIIVGGTTYGKGTAQLVMPLDTVAEKISSGMEDFVKVTESKFYRVDGSTTQWKGVEPDIELPDLYALDEFREKSQQSALKPDLSKAGIYTALNPIPIAALKKKSAERVASSKYYQSVNSFSAMLKSRIRQQIIPLQWKAFAEEYISIHAMYKHFQEAKEAGTLQFKVSNNSFDEKQVASATDRTQSVNATYLKNVEEDKDVEEAFQILTDLNHL